MKSDPYTLENKRISFEASKKEVRNNGMMEYWVQMQIKIILDDRSPARVVIPGLTKPAPYVIRGNPVFPWIPAQASLGFAERRAPRRAFAGMTFSARINVTIYRNFFTHYSNIPFLYFSFMHLSKIFLISSFPLMKLGSKGNLPFKKRIMPGKRESAIKSLLLSMYSINMVTS